MSATPPAPTTPTPIPVLHDWSFGYPLLYASVPLARHHATRRLDLWHWKGDRADVALVVGELVANAVSHAKVVDRELLLRLAEAHDGALFVEVSDPVRDFAGFDRLPPAPDETDERGRGLYVVRALVAELTWAPRPHVGKTVRARMASTSS
ncbi:ATP-binding protein [Streptomyces sp. NPDC055092]